VQSPNVLIERPEVRLLRTAALLGAGAGAIASLALLWLFSGHREDERQEDDRGRELHVEDGVGPD
jgi:hypothetical protein